MYVPSFLLIYLNVWRRDRLGIRRLNHFFNKLMNIKGFDKMAAVVSLVHFPERKIREKITSTLNLMKRWELHSKQKTVMMNLVFCVISFREGIEFMEIT